MKPILFIAAIVIAIILLLRYNRKQTPAPTRLEALIADSKPASDIIHENAVTYLAPRNFTLGGGQQGYSPRPTL